MKQFRVYFNRKREAPQVWSIDEGTQASEINVINFFTHGCPTSGRYNGEKANDNSPSAWMVVEADYYYIVEGIAHFSRHPADGRA